MSKQEKKEFTPKHFALLYFGVMIVALTFIGIMKWLGYAFISMGAEYLLFGVLIVSALVAGLAFLLGRIMNRAVKIAAGAVGGVLIVAVAVVLLVVFTVMLNLNTPAHYTTVKSPEGKTAVIMRQWGSDPDLVDIRAAERWAANPEVEEEYTRDDLGYNYFAAPRVLGLFYNEKQLSEGYLEIGVTSDAQLMYIWEGENLRLYIEGAREGDAGETILNMK